MSRDTKPLARTHYTPAEVAVLLGVTERHIRNLCNASQMPCVRVGRYLRIPMAQFEQYLKGASSAASA